MTDDEKLVLGAQMAMDLAAINGIITVLIRLRRKGLFDVDDLKSVHSMMTKPLNLPENASNKLVQMQQQKLDDLFAELVRP